MKTLLLADDSVTIQRVIELTFAHEDVRVVSVADGRRALQWIERETPDVVLVDVAAPEVNGYAVAAHVKQSPRLAGVPVLLLAGAFEPVDEERAASVGCDGVLVKPFEPQELVSRVKTLLGRAGTGEGIAARPGPEPAPAPRETDSAGVVTPFPGPGRFALASTPLEAATAPERRDREPLSPSRVSLANAFSALLAAEQSAQPVAPSAPAVSDAAIEEAVRRVLVRMTDETVRRIVVETAERLIREEIEKLKAKPE